MLGIPSHWIGGIGMAVSYLFYGPEQTFAVFYNRIWGVMIDYTFLAVPLFVFMGLMLERSGISEKVVRGHLSLDGTHSGWPGHCHRTDRNYPCRRRWNRGASVVMLGLIAYPAMHARGYKKN